jgi:hypothetical protein
LKPYLLQNIFFPNCKEKEKVFSLELNVKVVKGVFDVVEDIDLDLE